MEKKDCGRFHISISATMCFTKCYSELLLLVLFYSSKWIWYPSVNDRITYGVIGFHSFLSTFGFQPSFLLLMALQLTRVVGSAVPCSKSSRGEIMCLCNANIESNVHNLNYFSRFIFNSMWTFNGTIKFVVMQNQYK